MKALVLKEEKAPLVYEDVEVPEAGEGQAVVQVKAAALNRRDFWITRGLYPGITAPCVLGTDGAGVVSAVGDGVDPSWIGKEVVIYPGTNWGESTEAQHGDFKVLGMPAPGTFAEMIPVSAEMLVAKPEHLSWPEAAALPIGGLTSYRALFAQGRLQADETVLVTGIGGGVATFSMQFAVAAGAKVWVTSSSPRKIQKAGELGAQGGFDYTSESWSKEFLKLAGPANLIIDSAAGAGYRDLVGIAAPGGRIVNYGATAGLPPKLDMFKVFWKQLHLIGSTMGSPQEFEAMIRFVIEHQIKPVIDEVVPLSEGSEAVEKMKSSPQFGNIVLSV